MKSRRQIIELNVLIRKKGLRQLVSRHVSEIEAVNVTQNVCVGGLDKSCADHWSPHQTLSLDLVQAGDQELGFD